nr:hypothetical protein [Mycoplasmopsis bovis]
MANRSLKNAIFMKIISEFKTRLKNQVAKVKIELKIDIYKTIVDKFQKVSTD